MRWKFPIHSFKTINQDDKGIDVEELVNCEIPFNSTNKFNLIIRDMFATDDSRDTTPERKNMMVIMKGAPERIFGRCSHILINGEEVKVTEFHEEAFANANKELGGQGEWVLAFARIYLDPLKFPKDFKFNMAKDEYNFPM